MFVLTAIATTMWLGSPASAQIRDYIDGPDLPYLDRHAFVFLEATPERHLHSPTFEVEVVRLIYYRDCFSITPAELTSSSPSEPLTKSGYAVVKILSRRNTSYAGKELKVCLKSDAAGGFRVGNTGTVIAAEFVSKAVDAIIPVVVTYRENINIRRGLGAFCVWSFCFDLPKFF